MADLLQLPYTHYKTERHVTYAFTAYYTGEQNRHQQASPVEDKHSHSSTISPKGLYSLACTIIHVCPTSSMHVHIMSHDILSTTAVVNTITVFFIISPHM